MRDPCVQLKKMIDMVVVGKDLQLHGKAEYFTGQHGVKE